MIDVAPRAILRGMRLAIDSHVHIYPFYSPHRLFDSAHRNLSRIAPTAERLAICLTERAGYFAFEALARGDLVATPWKIAATPEPNVLHASTSDGRALYVLAGRQIITAERLEVLALGVDLRLEDGAPVRDVIAQVRTAGACPVLPWGLGKWWGRRGQIVRQLVNESTPGQLALGDTYLLPALAFRPTLLRQAEARGFRVLAGTDPLGHPGEEEIIGHYGVLADATFEEDRPGTSLLRILGDPAQPLTVIGRRGSLTETISRMW